jgi:hypothetical protein
MKKMKLLGLIGFITTFFITSAFAQQTGSITGQVYDSLGAVLVGATVTAVDSTGKEKSVVSNRQGEFSITGLAPGKYIVRATAPKFSLYENTEVEVSAGKKQELTIAMTIETIVNEVEVGNQNEVDTDPSRNASATVLSEKDIKDLPDDPDELAAYLQAMAGPASGPDGAQISIDGFSGGRLPPKEAIREIRFNQNPFSAEYDRIGFGRVEILTKPGYGQFRGNLNFNFNDESLNSRNPFVPNRAPSQVRNFGGFLSGPITAKKSQFAVDFSYNQNDNGNVIKATILDANNNIVGFDQDVTVPSRRFSIGPRIDFAINDNNTVQVNYGFSRNTSENQGVGGFSLPSRASDSENTQHEIRIAESMIINAKTVNETRFQFERNNRQQTGDNSIPTIQVSQAFTGGGAQVGMNYNKSNRWELQNYTTTSFGKESQHAIKFGTRIRGISFEDRSESNYGGTFSFFGFVDNGVVVSSIEQYRQKVLGNPDPRYNPSQFSITAGNPVINVSQVDYAFFVTDDWKARKDLTVSFGVRYENQTNISSNLNFAPRIGVAWSPGAGGARQPKTVFRGGFGVFFERFSENFVTRALRNDGVSQLQYTVTNPLVLGQVVFTNSGVTNIPTINQLSARSSIPYRIADNVEAPYSIQSVFSVERQLPWRTTVSATYINARSLHTLRMRNINAPVCPSTITCPSDESYQLLRPDPTQGNIFQYESSGSSRTNQLVLNFNTRFSNRVTLFGNYILGASSGDSDSMSSPRMQINFVGFPAYSYDLSNEWAPSAFVSRHTFFTGGSISLPFGFRMSPTIIYNSTRRFNITSGVDSNRDSIQSERPTYAALKAACDARGLTASYCDVSGISNLNTVIPRNYGIAPGSFVVNMNLSKTFGFGGGKANAVGQNGQQQGAGNQQGGNRGGGNRGGGGGGNRGGGGGPQMVMMGPGGGFFGGGDTPKPYNLTLGINVNNLFNTVNLGTPQGSITSPYFGQSISTGGGFGFFGGGGGSANRRVNLSMRFNW